MAWVNIDFLSWGGSARALSGAGTFIGPRQITGLIKRFSRRSYRAPSHRVKRLSKVTQVIIAPSGSREFVFAKTLDQPLN
jgi:hypothetical protein